MSTERVTFNINQQVEVVFTEHGATLWNSKSYGQLRPATAGVPYTEQAWVLMHELGPHLWNGSRQVFAGKTWTLTGEQW